jgi:hypothetical protein
VARDAGGGGDRPAQRGPRGEHPRRLDLGGRGRRGVGECAGHEPVNLGPYLVAHQVALAGAHQPRLVEPGLEASDRVARHPGGKLLRGHVLGARRLLVAADPERLALEQRRALARPGLLGRPRHRIAHRHDVVAVDDPARHAVARRPVGQVGAGVLLADRRRQAPLVVLDHEQHAEAPHRRQVHRLVDVALAGGAVADQHGGDAVLAPQAGGEGQSVGHGRHRPEVADHADDVVVEGAEVECAVAPARVAAGPPEELAEQHPEVEPSAREHGEVAVHRQQPVVGPQRSHEAHRHGLLPDAREPLRQLAPPQQVQHPLLDRPR